MAQERTEQPTAKKLREAQEKGNSPRSRDLALAAASVAATMALARLGGHVVSELMHVLAADLAQMGDRPLRVVSAPDLTNVIIRDGQTLAMLVGPVAIAAMVAGVGMHGVQGGWTLTAEGLTLKWDRLSPAAGLKKLGFKQSGLDTVKAFVSAGVIGYLGWGVIKLAMTDSLRLAWLPPLGAAAALSTWLQSLLWSVGWSLAVIAGADYALQRYRVMSSLKMTKQEVRDEARQNEGNPEVKGRVRRVQREMSRRRMLNDVRRATVVVTNPTHFAVALEYHRGMGAPLVLAKGQDYLAQRIRERAREHGVPIVENKPLAQALYKTAEVGDTIPGPLFAAVAEVLAQLIRLKQILL